MLRHPTLAGDLHDLDLAALGAAEARPVVRDGAVAVATLMSCTLSVDHRCVDGVLGAQFLAAFKAIVELPIALAL